MLFSCNVYVYVKKRVRSKNIPYIACINAYADRETFISGWRVSGNSRRAMRHGASLDLLFLLISFKDKIHFSPFLLALRCAQNAPNYNDFFQIRPLSLSLKNNWLHSPTLSMNFRKITDGIPFSRVITWFDTPTANLDRLFLKVMKSTTLYLHPPYVDSCITMIFYGFHAFFWPFDCKNFGGKKIFDVYFNLSWKNLIDIFRFFLLLKALPSFPTFIWHGKIDSKWR